jgi:hypothetical protein
VSAAAPIAAIETRYKGYRFRSRLEARWAVFFDALGLEWRYEPEGFKKEGFSGGPLCYLPDFLIVKENLWVEVIGSTELLRKEEDWLTNFLDFGSPLPDFTNSYDTQKGGLLILGDIPEPKFGLYLHPIVQDHKGLLWSRAHFHRDGVDVLAGTRGNWLDWFFKEDPRGWATEAKFIPTHYGCPGVKEAYAAARSARFEHGETP